MSSVPAAATASRWRDLVRQSYGLIQALAVLILLVVVISLFSPRFLTWINLHNHYWIQVNNT